MSTINICPVCRKKIGKTGYKIQCSGECGKWVHLGCTDIKKEDLESSKRVRVKYICSACKKNSLSSSDESDSAEECSSLDESNGSKIKLLNKYQKSSENTKFSQMTRKKRRSSTESMLENISKKLEKLEESLTFQNEMMENLRNTLEAVTSENRKLKKEQDFFKNKVTHLQEEVDKLKSVRQLEDRSYNLVVMGLQTDGSPEAVNVKKLINKLKVDITDEEYSIKNIPSKMPHKPLIIRFTSKEKRDSVLQHRKTRGVLTSAELGLPGEERNVYINEDLPKYIRDIHNRARTLKSCGYKFIWVKDGHVFCRNRTPQRSLNWITANK